MHAPRGAWRRGNSLEQIHFSASLCLARHHAARTLGAVQPPLLADTRVGPRLGCETPRRPSTAVPTVAHGASPRRRIPDPQARVQVDVLQALAGGRAASALRLRLRSCDQELGGLRGRIAEARAALARAEDKLRDLRVSQGKATDRMNRLQQDLAELDARLADAALAARQHEGLRAIAGTARNA